MLSILPILSIILSIIAVAVSPNGVVLVPSRAALGNMRFHSFVLAMGAFQVPVTQCEQWAVVTAFGGNGIAQVK